MPEPNRGPLPAQSRPPGLQFLGVSFREPFLPKRPETVPRRKQLRWPDGVRDDELSVRSDMRAGGRADIGTAIDSIAIQRVTYIEVGAASAVVMRLVVNLIVVVLCGLIVICVVEESLVHATVVAGRVPVVEP